MHKATRDLRLNLRISQEEWDMVMRLSREMDRTPSRLLMALAREAERNYVQGAQSEPIRFPEGTQREPKPDYVQGSQAEPSGNPLGSQKEPVGNPLGTSVGDIGGNGSLSNQPEEKATLGDGQGEPKKPRAPKAIAEHPGFEEFWAAYPARCGRRDRAKAVTRWNQHKPPLEAVLAALTWQDRMPEWVKDDGEFIPAPDAWLHQHKWEREKPVSSTAPVLTSNPHLVDHQDWCRVDRKLGKTARDYPEQTLAWMKHRSFEIAGDYGSCAL